MYADHDLDAMLLGDGGVESAWRQVVEWWAGVGGNGSSVGRMKDAVVDRNQGRDGGGGDDDDANADLVRARAANEDGHRGAA